MLLSKQQRHELLMVAGKEAHEAVDAAIRHFRENPEACTVALYTYTVSMLLDLAMQEAMRRGARKARQEFQNQGRPVGQGGP